MPASTSKYFSGSSAFLLAAAFAAVFIPTSALAQCQACVNGVTVPPSSVNVLYTLTGNPPWTQPSTPTGAVADAPGYFEVTLSGVPSGYWVTNGTVYDAWCADYFNASVNTNPFTGHPLYSTYGTIPAGYTPLNGNFNEINYILNNKSGTLQDVQDAIWMIMVGSNGGTLSAASQAMYTAALQHPTFVPSVGGVMAVLYAAEPLTPFGNFQNLFLEVPMPIIGTQTLGIGNFVWNDLNHNGIQDANEPGINGVTVQLLNSTGTTVLATTVTTINAGVAGYYQFSGFGAGTYQVKVDLAQAALTGMTVSPSLAGADRAVDSNGSPTTVTLTATSQSDETLDFGFYSNAVSSISGTTYVDVNADHVFNAGDIILSTPSVALTGPCTTTQSKNGANYLFSSLTPGCTYAVTSPVTVGHLTGDTPSVITVPLTNTGSTGNNFGYVSNANICGLSPGYWKNHGGWPVTTLVLGNVTYTQAELLNLLTIPKKGDSSIILAFQLIAAKLNVASGTLPSTAGTNITAADALLAALPLPNKLPIAKGVKNSQMEAIGTSLNAFNNDGQLQPGCTQ